MIIDCIYFHTQTQGDISNILFYIEDTATMFHELHRHVHMQDVIPWEYKGNYESKASIHLDGLKYNVDT